MLKLAFDVIELTVLDEPCPGLLEPERYACFGTDIAKCQYPIEVARANIASGFSTCDYLLRPLANIIWCEVDAFQQRFADDNLMPDGGGAVDREAVICPRLVLDGAADGNVVITLAPVGRQALNQTVDTFRDHHKVEVTPYANHLPGLRAPCVGIFYKEVGGETGVDHRAGRNLVLSVPFPAGGQIETLCLRHDRAIHLPTGITPIDIAVATTLTQLVASVPRIPKGGFFDDGIDGHKRLL